MSQTDRDTPVTPAEPRTEECGALAHGGLCVLPRGHNMGKPDVPSQHEAAASRMPATGLWWRDGAMVIEADGGSTADDDQHFVGNAASEDDARRIIDWHNAAITGRPRLIEAAEPPPGRWKARAEGIDTALALLSATKDAER